MYTKVLVPLDGSTLAEAALPYAEKIATAFGSDVTLLGICEPAKGEFCHMYEHYVEHVARSVRSHVRQQPGAEGKSRVKVRFRIAIGQPAEEIIAHTAANNISLVVATSHGTSGLKRLVMGSVANRLLREIAAPMILIRCAAQAEACSIAAMNRILVPIDGSTASEAVLPHVEQLATKLKGEVILLGVVELGQHVRSIGGLDYFRYPDQDIEARKKTTRDYLERLGSRLKGTGATLQFETRAGDSAHEIIKVADEVGAGLTIISTHGQSGAGRWAFGGVADKVLQGARTPVMLVRATAAHPDTGPKHR